MEKEQEKHETKPEAKPDGVKVTKGGISKYVDSSQVEAYKANGWKQ